VGLLIALVLAPVLSLSGIVIAPSPALSQPVSSSPASSRPASPPASRPIAPAHGHGNHRRRTARSGYPSPAATAAARRFLDGRAGRTSFAVVDSRGRLSGVRLHARFQTASVVKVMMLVAYLQMLKARHRDLDAASMGLLYPMIHVSDNEAASAVLAIVGGDALARVARESGMTAYAPGVGWWAYTQTSAADQARFFFVLPRLIPRRFYGYARFLLAGIEPSQSWGVPPVARPRGWQVFFKTGALPSEGLFNEAARLERPGVTFTIAVFSEGDPSMEYGERTIQGVAAALLRRTPQQRRGPQQGPPAKLRA